MTIPLKHDRRSEPVPDAPQEPAGRRRRHPMQHAARGKREAPEETGAPEYYAKDRTPSVAKPGPGDGTGGEDGE